jgi:hypothetical protein
MESYTHISRTNAHLGKLPVVRRTISYIYFVPEIYFAGVTISIEGFLPKIPRRDKNKPLQI